MAKELFSADNAINFCSLSTIIHINHEKDKKNSFLLRYQKGRLAYVLFEKWSFYIRYSNMVVPLQWMGNTSTWNTSIPMGRFINSLHGISRGVVLAQLAWDDFKSNNRSLIVNLFWGQHKSTLQCSRCGTQSIKFETFSHLSVFHRFTWKSACNRNMRFFILMLFFIN